MDYAETFCRGDNRTKHRNKSRRKLTKNDEIPGFPDPTKNSRFFPSFSGHYKPRQLDQKRERRIMSDKIKGIKNLLEFNISNDETYP
uniref:Uncharacterized protein n=1 Tax=Romanomermis culicivorax TaxID=13658 RepID=A0A915HY47_ROMCU